jgi:hypothetical protein
MKKIMIWISLCYLLSGCITTHYITDVHSVQGIVLTKYKKIAILNNRDNKNEHFFIVETLIQNRNCPVYEIKFEWTILRKVNEEITCYAEQSARSGKFKN